MIAIRNIQLTKKEVEVLGLIKHGLNTKEVAGQLSISMRTVANIRGSIIKKFGLRDSNSLLKYIVECTVENGLTIII